MTANLKTIIIGGQGFIGKNLTKLLLKNGRQITVISKKIIPYKPHPNLRVIENDCSNINSLLNIFNKADEIVNLAYNSVPKTSFDQPIRDIEKNLPFTINIFRAASKTKIKKIINLSTGGAIYGKQNRFPIKESQSLRPISPYAITKMAIENYSRLFQFSDDLPIINLRPANAYGYYQEPFAGQGIISTIINSIILNRHFTLFGKEIIRDYLFINDLVEGIKHCLEKGRIGQIYNLGTGIGTNNYQLLQKIISIAKSFKYKIPKHKILSSRSFDVDKNILDSQKIYQDTGWKAQINLKVGLEKTWQWYLENH